MNEAWVALELAAPLVISGVLHMIAVKLGMLRRLAIPIHAAWFGKNKTWRGFVLMPLLSILAMALCRGLPEFHGTPWVALGFWLGVGYTLFELPNSFFKRRMGVAPGKLPTRNRWVFLAMDLCDSTAGCAIVYVIFLKISLCEVLWLFAVGALVHLGVNLALYGAGIRKEPF